MTRLSVVSLGNPATVRRIMSRIDKDWGQGFPGNRAKYSVATRNTLAPCESTWYTSKNLLEN